MIKILSKNVTKEILELCKTNSKTKEDKLMFVDLGRDMFENNKYILNKYFRNKDGQDCYYANLLAYKNIPGITLYDIKKQLKADFGKSVSLAGYKYNPEHYIYASCRMQNEYEDDLFRNKSIEEERAEVEADRRSRIEELDFKAVESLYTVLFKSLKTRWVMLLNLEDIPGIINNALDCYFKGVNCSMSNAAMYTKINEIRTLLENKELIEWLKTKPTDLMFDKFDYVNTYQKVLRQLTGLRRSTKEIEALYKEAKDISRNWIKEHNVYKSIVYFQDALAIDCQNPAKQWYELIHNEEDIWEEDILANECLEYESYIENNYTEDEDNYLD